LEILQFFDFQDGHRPPSWILKILNFWSTIRFGILICITVRNFTKIGPAVAEISHLTIFKMAAVRHFGFVWQILGQPTTRIGGLYHCAKFDWNRFSRIDNTKV